jgi:hypothetical protein
MVKQWFVNFFIVKPNKNKNLILELIDVRNVHFKINSIVYDEFAISFDDYNFILFENVRKIDI